LAAVLEHDPEKWEPIFRKIMLKQEIEARSRFHLKPSRARNYSLKWTAFCISLQEAEGLPLSWADCADTVDF
jgi:hypothetical protein